MSGSQANQFGETAEDGQPNLYLEHDGTITFVMDAGDHDPKEQRRCISPNGAFLAFNSASSLTGYENNGRLEIYLYSAAANRFECASCNPSGEAPTAAGVRPRRCPACTASPTMGRCSSRRPKRCCRGTRTAVIDVYEFDYDSGLHLISTGTSSSESRPARRERERQRRVLPHVSGSRAAGQLPGSEQNLRRARGRRLSRSGAAAGVHDGRCVPRGARAAALDLRGAVEPDVLRRGQPRAAAVNEGEAQDRSRSKCKKGFVEEEGQVREEIEEAKRASRNRRVR